MNKAEVRAALLKAAESEIDQLLAWDEVTEEMTLTNIEDKVLAARQRMGQVLAEKLIELQEGKRNAEIPVNAESGKRLHPKLDFVHSREQKRRVS